MGFGAKSWAWDLQCVHVLTCSHIAHIILHVRTHPHRRPHKVRYLKYLCGLASVFYLDIKRALWLYWYDFWNVFSVDVFKIIGWHFRAWPLFEQQAVAFIRSMSSTVFNWDLRWYLQNSHPEGEKHESRLQFQCWSFNASRIRSWNLCQRNARLQRHGSIRHGNEPPFGRLQTHYWRLWG